MKDVATWTELSSPVWTLDIVQDAHDILDWQERYEKYLAKKSRVRGKS